MIDAKIDTAELARTAKLWAKEFGDTNEEALMRLSAEACRQFAQKVQPWGMTKRSRRKIERAIFMDAGKTVISVMDARVWFDIKTGKTDRLPNRNGKWQKINTANILHSEAEIDRFIESQRRDGRIRGNIAHGQRGIAWHADVTRVMKKRMRLAGIAKGAFLMAGRKISMMASKRGLGIGARYGKWAVDAAQGAGVIGTASLLKSMYKPVMTITNPAKHTRSPRILKERDIQKGIHAAFKKVIRYYQVAVHAIEKRAK